jgi:hypothetical protein
MIIANPIYDVVFKRMLENERVAKFFIGTLLEQTVVSVEVKPQKFTYEMDKESLAVFRLDFIATIVTASGETKKVLIEIQKAHNQIDLMRFRNYLGEQCRNEDVVGGQSKILPITTIYFLGTNLPEIETPCIRVERNYLDLINKKVLEKKSWFVERLTHDSFVVQMQRITGRYQTRLDKLLSVFEQAHFVDDKKIIKEFTHETDDEEIKLMTDILHHSGTNPVEKKKIEDEQEAWRSYYALFGEELEKHRQALREKDQALIEKEQALSEKDQALSEKDQALSEKDRLIEELMKKLNQQGG